MGIINYFQEVDRDLQNRQRFFMRTGKGLFVPSHLPHIDTSLEHLIAEELIGASSVICDAGGGDGRVGILASGRYGIPALAMEYDRTLVDDARTHIAALSDQPRALQRAPEVLQGDFTDGQSYHRAGIPFEHISVFFNYICNWESIARKIAEESPSGTLFLLHGIGPRQKELDGLHHLQTLKLEDSSRMQTIPPHGNTPLTSYMQVFRKP